MITSKLQLPTITLCTLGSEKYREQNQRALDKSCEGIEFGAVKNIIMDTNSMDDWSYNIIYRLHHHIDTDFALIIHPDGYVVHPECWDDQFLAYDYIGAPWPLPTDDFSYRDKKGDIIRIGNSVSIRSKRLLQLADRNHLLWQSFHGFSNEDGFVCVNNRHEYIKAGMTFAPIEIAKYFSRECEVTENQDVEKTFCFHKFEGKNKIYEDFEA